MNMHNPDQETAFDRFLAAVKLLADAAETAADFDDFALHLEEATAGPLYDANPGQYLYNVQNTLEEGLEILFAPMGGPIGLPHAVEIL